MKKRIYATAILGIVLLSACQSDETSSNESMDDAQQSTMNTAKFEGIAAEPCNLLTLEMVSERFGVKQEDLDLSNYSAGTGKVSWSSYCNYSWKKPDFEEIYKRSQEKLIAALTGGGGSKDAVTTAMEMEKAKFEVGVTNLQIYDDAEKARNSFIQAHTVPEKKDVDKLNEAIDASNDPALTDGTKGVGKDVVGGIAANLKFDQVDGIGTLAYWDYLGGKLDVLFGTLQIGITMHISDNHDENVKAAMDLANEIMNGF